MANVLSRILRYFQAGTPGFNDYEMAILDAIAKQLSEESRERLQRRIEGVNLVQRLDGGREVNSYVMKGRHPMMEDSTRLDSSAGEKLLAEFDVLGSIGTANSGKAWLVDGNLFSLEFDEPTEHARKKEISDVVVTISLFPRQVN